MGVPQPGTEGLKRLTVLAVVMAVAAGIGIIRVPRDERIDIGRPLGSMYIKVSKDLTYERRGTSAYAIIRKRYGEGSERKVVRTLQAGITYLPQPPTGWEDATWPVRAAMVANGLLDAKHPGRTGRTCWVGKLTKSPDDWMALPYQQTFYNSEGFANENYRGIFLIFRPPTGGALLLDVFARRLHIDDTTDWLEVRDYLLDVNKLMHVKDMEHPGLVAKGKSGLDQLRKVSLPKQNPLCLGSYLVNLPEGTTFDIAAGGYYQLRDSKLGLEAFLSYGEQIRPDIVDSYQALKPGCRSQLEVLQPAAAPSQDADAQVRYTRTMNPPPNEKACPETHRFFGVLATRRLAHDVAITFDVFVRGQEDQRSVPTKRWRQIADYLRSLQRQTLSNCAQPGTGNDPGGTRPIPLRTPPNGQSGSALLVETKSDRRCMI